MTKTSRNLFSFLLFIGLLFVLYWLMKNLSINGLSDLWTNPDNRKNIIIGVISSIAYAILVLMKDTILRWGNALVLKGRSIDQEKERVAQEKIYLENLVARLKRELPWDTDKYTELEAIQEDLEQQARRIQTRIWGKPESSEATVEGNVRNRVNLQHFLENEKQPVMLKGDPGTGKTLTVRKFIVEQASKSLSFLPDEVRLPIYIPLEYYTGKDENGEPESVYDFMYKYIKEAYPGAEYLREHLTQYLLSGRLIVIFDGLNELLPHEYDIRYKKIEEFIFQKYPRAKYILTCRTLRFTSSTKFSTIAISELSEETIKRFITAYLGATASDRLFRELSSGDGFMLRVCRNPFMLQMLVRRNPNRPTPSSPSQLFIEYIYDKLSLVISDKSEKIIDTLCKLAFKMQEVNVFAGAADLDLLRKTLRIANFDEYLDVAQKTQLIDYTPDKKFRFYHQILQEHFAALLLRSKWETNENIDQFRDDYRWEETLIVCSGLVVDSEKFIKEIWSSDTPKPNRLWLAMKCIGVSGKPVNQDYFQAILASSKQLLYRRKHHETIPSTVLTVETLKALSYIDNSKTNEIVNDVLLSNEGWIREVCAQILGNSRNPEAKNFLSICAVKLRSTKFLTLIAPFYQTDEFVKLITTTPLALYFVLETISFFLRYLLPIAPFLFLPLLIGLSNRTGLNLTIFFGRFGSLYFMLLVVQDKLMSALDLRSRKLSLSQKIVFIARSFNWGDVAMICISILIWIFAGEIMGLLYILNIILAILSIGYLVYDFIKTLRHPIKLAYKLYADEMYRFSSFMPVAYAIIRIGAFLNKSSKLPTGIPREISLFETITNRIIDFAFIYLFPIPFWIFMVIGSVSLFVIVFTLIKFFMINRITKTAKLGIKQYIDKLIEIALNESELIQVRERAIKLLRFVDLPAERIRDLEGIFSSHSELRRELERTIYELKAQALKSN